VLVTLRFTPERFHVLAFQQHGRVSTWSRCPANDDEPQQETVMKRWKLLGPLLALTALALPVTAAAQTLVKLKAGMVTGIDQVGLPIALERGFFEKHGLDVTVARPYATGVDALNALQAGESDIVQVGVPMIGAVLRGMDLVALGNYSGSATKLGSDATMALVAREGSGIDKNNLAKGKKVAASFGTINHLYALALIEKAGLTPADVTLVNTPPPDMTVALLSKGIDAFSGWDPWPIIAQKDVPGAYAVIRGGDVISYLGFNVATRGWVEKNGETIEKFLAAVAEADKWMRANPKLAAQVATRWIPGLKQDVAEAAMQFNIQQNDRRLSANNYRALWAAQDRLNRLGILKSTFDVNKHIEPKHMLKVMKDKPELFSDLPPIPGDVSIGPGFVFKP
jgi:sulfonate transport system substrate-binding protein